jgi:hypothetical protein
MLKKILYNFYINYTYNKIISKEIKTLSKQIDYNNTWGKDAFILKKNGIIQLDGISDQNNSLNFLNNICDYKLKNFNFKNRPIASFSYIHSNDSLTRNILSNHKINSIIKNYLGEDARLDTISLSVTKDNTQDTIISEKWHYDNVGRRLKLFYYLNDNENICTDYVLKTNNQFHKYYSTDGSRRSSEFIKKYKDDIKSFFPQKGKILIFDTNGFHRGNYKEKIKNNFEDYKFQISFRKMLKFEFSSAKKSDLFFGKSNTIGVRTTFFSKDFDFSNCPLVDNKYLNNIDNVCYYYDKEYKNNYNS